MPRNKSLFVLAAGTVLVGFLAVALAGASDQAQGQFKLGGAWIGKELGGGHLWTCTQAPLDSDAREMTLHVKFTTYSPAMAGLAASFGADSFSDFVGEGVMVNRTAARWTMVGYALRQGNPPTVELILVVSGTFEFTDIAHATLQYTVTVYVATADANGDGMPDADATPLVSFPVSDTAQRVPILQ
jgi:hypothetical protein